MNWREQLAAGELAFLDVHLAKTLAEIGAETNEQVHLAIALLSRAVRNGHVCLDLNDPVQSLRVDEAERLSIRIPPRGPWMEALEASALVGCGSGNSPLVLDNAGRLYVRRYWQYEQEVAQDLKSRAVTLENDELPEVVRELVGRLFPPAEPGSTNWQELAALVALRRQFCVVSGGPGTGKTYSVARMLALLAALARAREQRAPRVELLAPTGKAAARLAEALRENRDRLPVSDELRAAIPTEAKTIHRCLGATGHSEVQFRHHRENPLVADVVVVDESSMIDLALMAHLLAALPRRTRLILLGDENQLASVEAGSVLGDICDRGVRRSFSRAQWQWLEAAAGERLPVPSDAPQDAGLADSIVRLERNYRYTAHSGIGLLAKAILSGNADDVRAALAADVSTAALLPPNPPWQLGSRLVDECCRGFRPYLETADAQQRLQRFGHYRVLCANRFGPYGVLLLNQHIERALARHGILRDTVEEWYDGRPVLVTENDYGVRLFNGDLGIVMAAGGAAPLVAFPETTGTGIRKVGVGRLPGHETAFAMTIHKSQGSEFDVVEVVLPPSTSPLLTRELVYTAVTRAKQCVRIHAEEQWFLEAVAKPTQRSSGLRDALWGRVGNENAPARFRA